MIYIIPYFMVCTLSIFSIPKQDDIEKIITDLNYQFKNYSRETKKVNKIDLDDTQLLIIYKDNSVFGIDLSQISIKNMYSKGKSYVSFECTNGNRYFKGLTAHEESGITLNETISLPFDSYSHATVIKQNLLKIQKIIK